MANDRHFTISLFCTYSHLRRPTLFHYDNCLIQAAQAVYYSDCWKRRHLGYESSLSSESRFPLKPRDTQDTTGSGM